MALFPVGVRRVRLYASPSLRIASACMCRDRGCAQDPALAISADAAFGFAVENRSIDFVHRNGESLKLRAGLRLFIDALSDVSQFRFGVSTPGNRQPTGSAAAEEQGACDDNPGLEVGGVCELVFGSDVSGSVDPRIRI